jgi:hypothetical protein
VSIELPDEVVWVLNLIGLPWPTIDEDQLRAYASHLRTYAQSLSDTHGAAHSDITALSADYDSPSYDVLAERWAEFSSGHVSGLVEACHGFATALDVAADAVVVAKGVIIGALVAMAAEVAADQAAAVFTLGLAEAAEPAIIAGTRYIVKAALDQLEQQLVGEALEAVIGPLEDKLASAIQHMALEGVESMLA